MKTFASLCLSLVVLSLANGCMATYGNARMQRQASEREDFLLLEERLMRLEGRVESAEMASDELRRDWQFNQRDQESAAMAQLKFLEQRLDSVERRLAQLEASREKDKQEIIDRISSTVSELVGSRGGGSRGRASSSGYGYEHVVESGQTLSEIAAVYDTTVRAILQENNIQNPNQIRAGQVLFIPE